jgi:hypothetical protein
MTLLLREAEREPVVVGRTASSPPGEAHLSKRRRRMLPWELERLAEPISDLWNRRSGELHQGVGELLLVTFAEVRLDHPALRHIDLPDVCDLYMRMAPETTGPVASPKDDDRRSCLTPGSR